MTETKLSDNVILFNAAARCLLWVMYIIAMVGLGLTVVGLLFIDDLMRNMDQFAEHVERHFPIR